MPSLFPNVMCYFPVHKKQRIPSFQLINFPFDVLAPTRYMKFITLTTSIGPYWFSTWTIHHSYLTYFDDCLILAIKSFFVTGHLNNFRLIDGTRTDVIDSLHYLIVWTNHKEINWYFNMSKVPISLVDMQMHQSLVHPWLIGFEWIRKTLQ